MGNFKLTILGCGSATPTLRHMPSAQAVAYGRRLMLIDCGEGTQLQMRRYGVSFAKVSDIFISHLHGDHFLGLPGLLSTMALHDVSGTVTVHISAEGADILSRIMKVFCREMPYKLEYDILDASQPKAALETPAMTVSTFPLLHRVPCNGFIFREKPKGRHIDGEAVRYHSVPHYAIESLRNGADWIKPDGTTIPNALLTREASASVSYAYCSDTSYSPETAEYLSGTDVIYHESTYDASREGLAVRRGHSTALQAAMTALSAGAKKLILGHYSKTIQDEDVLVAEARTIFPNTIAATEGMVIDLDKVQ